MTKTVKNCAGSEILPVVVVVVQKLTYSSFMDIEIRYGTPGLGTLYYSWQNQQPEFTLTSVSSPIIPKEPCKKPSVNVCTHCRFILHERNTELLESPLV